MPKVQLSLTNQEAAILSSYGAQFGYNLPKVIRYIISKASEQFVNQGIVLTYPISEETEKHGLRALNEHLQGKSTQINDIKESINSL